MNTLNMPQNVLSKTRMPWKASSLSNTIFLSRPFLGLFSLLLLLFFGCRKAPEILIQSHLGKAMGSAFCQNQIFVADNEGASVKVFSSKGDFIKEIPGFLQAMDVACNKNRIYVADFGADQIVLLTPEGKRISSFGKSGAGKGEFAAPAGLALSESFLYVAEFYNHRIQKLTLDGSHIAFLGRKGHKDGEFFYPTDVFVDGEGLLVADAYNNRIQIFVKDHFKQTLSQKRYGLKVPSGIVVYKKHIYIADSENHRIVEIDKDFSAKKIWEIKDKLHSFSPTRLDLDPKNRLIIIDTARKQILSMELSEF